MQDSAQFHSTYLALVALVWNSLERIDQQLDCNDERTPEELQPQLQLLRLELLQLSDKSLCCMESGLVSVSQNTLVQRLVARLLGWLDLDAAANTEVARMRIHHAQNWLYDEAMRGEQMLESTDGKESTHNRRNRAGWRVSGRASAGQGL
jgi:hypothetical protein